MSFTRILRLSFLHGVTKRRLNSGLDQPYTKAFRKPCRGPKIALERERENIILFFVFKVIWMHLPEEDC